METVFPPCFKFTVRSCKFF